MKFPPDYPYSPPSIRFMTKVWHPNVYEVSEYMNYRSPAYLSFHPSLFVSSLALSLFHPTLSCVRHFPLLFHSPRVFHPMPWLSRVSTFTSCSLAKTFSLRRADVSSSAKAFKKDIMNKRIVHPRNPHRLSPRFVRLFLLQVRIVNRCELEKEKGVYMKVRLYYYENDNSLNIFDSNLARLAWTTKHFLRSNNRDLKLRAEEDY